MKREFSNVKKLLCITEIKIRKNVLQGFYHLMFSNLNNSILCVKMTKIADIFDDKIIIDREGFWILDKFLNN